MVDRWLVALGLALMGIAAQADDPEFATTAPAKVLLPVENTAPKAAETPAPGATAPPEAAKTADASVAAATPDATADDAIATDISAEMARQSAAENATPSTETTTPSADTEFPSPLKTLGRGVVSLCVTLAVILLIVAGIKRWGRRTPLLAGQQLARVIGRVGLSPQASLHFVQTNGEVLIIGVTQQNVSLLRTFDAADFESTSEHQTSKPTTAPRDPAASFLAQLKESRASMGVEAAADEDLDQLKGELQRLKQYFQDSTRARE